MKLSGRNRIQGKVKSIQTDNVAGKVIIDIGGGQTITSLITKDAVEDLGLSEGDQVQALIKSTNVMIMK